MESPFRVTKQVVYFCHNQGVDLDKENIYYVYVYVGGGGFLLLKLLSL